MTFQVRISSLLIIFYIIYYKYYLLYEESKSKEYVDTDICLINVIIIDSFEDKIICKVYVNSSQIPNDISCDFFFPYEDKTSIMIGGTGMRVILKNLNYSFIDKLQYEDHNLKNSCDCCIIF